MGMTQNGTAGMIEIATPDALGTTRIKVDGLERYTIQPIRMRQAAKDHYGQSVEYAVRATAPMSGQWFYLDPAEALGKAMDEVGKYYL